MSQLQREIFSQCIDFWKKYIFFMANDCNLPDIPNVINRFIGYFQANQFSLYYFIAIAVDTTGHVFCIPMPVQCGIDTLRPCQPQLFGTDYIASYYFLIIVLHSPARGAGLAIEAVPATDATSSSFLPFSEILNTIG